MNRTEIKNFSKQKIKDNLGTVWKAMIIVYLAELVISTACSKIFGSSNYIGFLGTSISAIILAPLTIGLLKYIEDFINDKKSDVKNIFDYYNNFLNIAIMTAISSVLISIGFILLVFPGIYLALSYALAPYLMMKNKKLDPIDALKKSRELMNGHKWELFVFGLSFLGWIILVAMTFGIAIIWVGPYMETATVKFYSQLVEAK